MQRADVDVARETYVANVVIQIELANGAGLSATFCALGFGAYGSISYGFQGTPTGLIHHHGLRTVEGNASFRNSPCRSVPRNTGRNGEV